MKLLTKILTGIVCSTIATSGVLAADDCSNSAYKQAHPERCKYASTSTGNGTFWAIGGGAVIGAGIAALIGMSNGNGGGGSSSGDNSYSANAQSYTMRTVMPTAIKRTSVGDDVSIAKLQSAISSNEYNTSNREYDDIQLAYSIARGYTGQGTSIAVFDTARGTFLNERNRTEVQHAEYVIEAISGPIAPMATVQHYTIADNRNDFYTYQQIGNIIASVDGANVYNNSWNVSNITADNIHSRKQLVNQTSAEFVNAISNAATQKDAIFVWAAGNDYGTQSGMLSSMPLVMPELNGHFVNVVAWDSETSTLADYSNSCGITKNYCITAPVTIKRESGNVRPGTSFAAPVVSAAIAVIREAWDYLESEKITQILFDTAADLGDAGVDDVYGHGMLDLEAATRPVGTPTIAISDTVSQPLQVARVSAQIAHNIKSANPTMAFFDKYGRDFTTSVSANISAHNRGLGFERMRGDDARVKFEFGDMEFGFYRNDMLSGTGFLQTNGDTTTTYIASNKTYNFGNFELFGRTQMGVARPTASDESIISEFSNIYTASAYVGVRGDKWSLSVGVPDTIVNGTMNLHLANGRNSAGIITYSDYEIDMASTPAIEYIANYRFMTAGYVDNPYGENEFYVFAKTKLAF